MKTNSRIKEFLIEENVTLKHELGKHNQKTHGNRGSAKRQEIINSLTASNKDKPEQPIEIHIKVYTDGKYDISKSYRVHTTAQRSEHWLNTGMDKLSKASPKSYNVYSLQDRKVMGVNSRLVGDPVSAKVMQGEV